jgi:predicted nuclease of restriction endonuclease-like (RecB) superfamily
LKENPFEMCLICRGQACLPPTRPHFATLNIRRGLAMSNLIGSKDYKALLQEIKQRVYKAQYEALKVVNKELIALYWDIGRSIVERQEKYGWGKSIVENLAKDLQAEFPGISGYSADNLWRMRKFYQHFKDNQKLAPLVQEISWTKIIVIMESCKDDLEREFYIRMTRKFGWTKNVLIHQIDNKTYEKTMSNQTNFTKALPEKIRNQAKLAVKDEYTFDFLELGEEHDEAELEKALIAKINRFLVEMGGSFAFMGNQFRLEIEGNEFFIDILLYHRHLKCLVAIELKTGKFLPEYVGKMQFYLAALDDMVRQRSENPSIGIIVSRSKNKTIVEYALRESKSPIGVSAYKIMTKLPRELASKLPSPEQVSILLDKI